MIEKAILKINPNASFEIRNRDINQITWHNGTTPIPKADIEARWQSYLLKKKKLLQKQI